MVSAIESSGFRFILAFCMTSPATLVLMIRARRARTLCARHSPRGLASCSRITITKLTRKLQYEMLNTNHRRLPAEAFGEQAASACAIESGRGKQVANRLAATASFL